MWGNSPFRALYVFSIFAYQVSRNIVIVIIENQTRSREMTPHFNVFKTFLAEINGLTHRELARPCLIFSDLKDNIFDQLCILQMTETLWHKRALIYRISKYHYQYIALFLLPNFLKYWTFLCIDLISVDILMSTYLYYYTLSHNYLAQSFSGIIKIISYQSQFPFDCVTSACSGNIWTKNHRNIFISLLDIDPSILAKFAAFTTMLKTWESYTTNCIATMEKCYIVKSAT